METTKSFEKWLAGRKELAQNLANIPLAQAQFGDFAKREIERATIAAEVLKEYYGEVETGEASTLV